MTEEKKSNFAERLLSVTGKLQEKAQAISREKPDQIHGDITNRLFAILIDFIILLPIAILPQLLMSFETPEQRTLYINGFQFLLLATYTTFFIYKFGATPGKIILGLKVVDNITGGKLSLSQTIIRTLAYITAPFGMLSGSIRKDKRCWHDFIADTVVIYSPNRWYKRHADALKARIKKLFAPK